MKKNKNKRIASLLLCESLISRMSEELKSSSMKVEEIVDRYVKCSTPELRTMLIDKLSEMRKQRFGIE